MANARLLLALGVAYLGAVAVGLEPTQMLQSWIETQFIESLGLPF